MAGRKAPPNVVITGATAGVGRAVARAYAAHGASIGLIARGRDGLAATACEVEQAGGRALVLPLDVADAEAVEAAAEQAEAELGPIDIWINAAFSGVLSRFVDMSLADYRRVTEVTYHGQVHGTMAALRRMMPRDHGVIVLVGSALAYRGIPLQSAYCGAKHAIQGFQDSLRAELIHAGSRVRLTMVQLPGVNTPQFDWIRTNMPNRPRPASAPYQPEVAAQAILFAARSGRKQVVAGFPAMKAILADRIASPLLDHYLAARGVPASRTRSRSRRDDGTISTTLCPATTARMAASTPRRGRSASSSGRRCIAARWASPRSPWAPARYSWRAGVDE